MPTLAYDACAQLIQAGHAQTKEKMGRPASVAFVDAHGDLIAFGRMDGAPVRSVAIAINKAFTATYTGRNTHEFNQVLAESGMQSAWYGDARVTGIPGGLLIKDGDRIVGAVGVSGLLPQEDLEIAEHILSLV